MQTETFIATVIKQGDKLTITIPIKLCRYAGINEKDQVKVLLRKEHGQQLQSLFK